MKDSTDRPASIPGGAEPEPRISSLAEMEAVYAIEIEAYSRGLERAAAIVIAAPSGMIAYAQIRAEIAALAPDMGPTDPQPLRETE
jgi:hypothetical protein